MRICYVSNNFEIHDYRFLKKFAEKKYDVHAISLRKNKINEEFRVDGIKYYEFCKSRRFYQKRYHGINPFWFFASVKFVKKIIEEIRPDILHGGNATISGFICALTGFHPFLLMPWGSEVLIEPDRNPVAKKILSFSVNHADKITCDAYYVKEKIVRMFNYSSDKIVVFPWGIDLNLFHQNNSKMPDELLDWQSNTIVICTRQHKKLYGIEYIIKAIPLVISQNNNVRFLFIGEGPLTGSYIIQADELNVVEYIKFIGRVENKFLPLYLNNSDIYISTSLSDGSSLCLMEALACGLPLIVTNIPANKEWVNMKNGFFVKKQNSKDLSEKVLTLSHNKKMRTEMGNHSYEVAKKNADWDKNFKKLEGIYDEISKI